MGVIIDGKYYPDKTAGVPAPTNSTIKAIHQDGVITRQAKAHAHNLIQPNNQDGTPNQDFINYYPEDAKAHGFIKEEKVENYDQTTK